MSLVDSNHVKLDLPRTGLDPFWERLLTEFAADDPLRWRCLAMLALRENSGWQLHQIGRVFGLHKGHVSRCLDRLKAELRDRYQLIDGRIEPSEAA